MSKRNKFVKRSPESEALTLRRKQNDISIRKLGELMDLSSSRVHQMESVREKIGEEYILKFLESLKVFRDDWGNYVSLEDKSEELIDKCIFLINKLDEAKMKKTYELLLKL
jgi:transcriptional regulator with XRE-family HTH domain